METITQDRLKELLHYDSNTGVVKRIVTVSNNAITGKVVGSITAEGYLCISIDYRSYYLHRLVWLYVYGYFPENQIDHINRDKTDNRIKNLREVSPSCNMRNMGNTKANTSGVKGVSWCKHYEKWQVSISIKNINRRIGGHKDFDEAVLHRLAGEQCLDWEGCDSSSPAYKYCIKHKLIKK